ncbi:uncharacterized protein LOC141589831 [Silene latifolia]|uniref:uncharacterized protein LOC141589831 n=1 Tax=Silene latifolia TaxID=37657 RepID=UPI003D772B9E
MSEVVGIIPLNLETLVDEPVVEEVANTSIPVVLDTIEEEPEELLQFTEAEVDKISFLPNGVFLVRFKSLAARTTLLKQGHFMFDNKPLIVKPWTPEIELVKHVVQSVPVWVKLHKLPLKFWGKGIAKISGLLGKFVKCDPATEDKVRIGYARLMIDIEFGKPLNDKVNFLDEHGNIVEIEVEYEWKPVVCSVCNGVGHDASDCRTAKKQLTPTDKGKGPMETTPDEVIQSTAQCINMKVKELASTTFYLSMVYAFNELQVREALWDQLVDFSAHITEPWLVCGDFNCVLYHAKRLGGSSSDTEIDDFQRCLTRRGLVDSPARGSFFTWNNKQDINTRVYSRLDRALVNQEQSDMMSNIYAHFLPEGIFDHTPCLLKSNAQQSNFKIPFKYFNM